MKPYIFQKLLASVARQEYSNKRKAPIIGRIKKKVVGLSLEPLAEA